MTKVKNDLLIFRLYFLAGAIIIGTAIVIGARMISDSIFMGQMISSRNISTAIEKTFRQAPSQAPRPIVLPGSKRIDGVTPGSGPIKGNVNAKVLLEEELAK